MNKQEFETHGEFGKANAFYPLLDLVGAYLKSRGNLRGVKLAWHCHLTALTAISAKALETAGCRVTLSECNPATTDANAVKYMRDLGFKTHIGPMSPGEALDEGADVISDTGFDMLTQWLSRGEPQIVGACEITTSGITRLRALESVHIPIININDGQIKSLIENFHGVGDGVIDALKILTGRSFQGERACVIGYGRVGAGAAHYLSRAGVQVTVVEPDPVRRLVAHFDGFSLASLPEAMSKSELMVTATGKTGLLSEKDWRSAADGILVINVGHWREELDLPKLEEISDSRTKVSQHIDEFKLKSNEGKPLRVRVAVNGDPCNVALLTGSIEPTLLHLAVELLSIEYLVTHKNELEPGELRVPAEVEATAAELALQLQA